MKTTRICLLFFLLFALSLHVHAQEKKAKLTAHGGYYYAGDYTRLKPMWKAYGFDFSYFITEHVFLTAHSNFGKNRYYEDMRTKFPDDQINLSPENKGTNADLFQTSIGLLVGYKQAFLKILNVWAAAGVSHYTEIGDNYPVRNHDNQTIFVDHTFRSMAFPVRVGIGINPIKSIEIGVAGGFYIEPSYPIVGWHVGPQISFLF